MIWKRHFCNDKCKTCNKVDWNFFESVKFTSHDYDIGVVIIGKKVADLNDVAICINSLKQINKEQTIMEKLHWIPLRTDKQRQTFIGDTSI